MASLKMLLQLSIVAAAYAKRCAGSTIHWGPCNAAEFDSTAPVDCGNVTVPLDYTDKTANKTLEIELVRWPAAVQPTKGSILINFGGPGITGRDALLSEGPLLQALSGGVYNLIVFDTRGTGKTIPMTCADKPEEINAIMAGVASDSLGNASDTTVGKLWATSTIIANKCYNYHNETGRLLSTAFVARDMMSIVDALNEDGMLRYWGFSYGTTLGATAVAMFPDRIDKAIIDGVQNPYDYRDDFVTAEQWTDADATLHKVFEWCVIAGPQACPLAKNATASQIEQEVWSVVYKLKYRPIAVGELVFSYSLAKQVMALFVKDISLWPIMTQVLNHLLNNDLPALKVIVDSILKALTPDDGSSALALPLGTYGIQCTDNRRRTNSLDELLPSLEREYAVSQLMGDQPVMIRTTCSQWKLDPKERYDGDFRVTPKNPILVAGNRYDSHTPMVSARNISAAINGSVVVEVNGYGHCSFSTPSSCSLKLFSDYWVNGTVPKTGTVCEAEGKPFSGIGWEQVIAAATGNKTIVKRDPYVQLQSLGRVKRGWWLA